MCVAGAGLRAWVGAWVGCMGKRVAEVPLLDFFATLCRGKAWRKFANVCLQNAKTPHTHPSKARGLRLLLYSSNKP